LSERHGGRNFFILINLGGISIYKKVEKKLLTNLCICRILCIDKNDSLAI
jgi:hypothetical protein